MDLTLSNPNVSAFFSKKTNEPPIKEFLYVHSHVISENFVSQIEGLILHASQAIQEMPENKKQATARQFEAVAALLGAQLKEINEENSPAILLLLRQIYCLCLEILY